MVKIAPSILSADFARLGAEVAAVEHAADWLHVDVMDGHFVPNITLGPPVIASLRKVTSLPLDCHLMISDPARYVDAFADAGADLVTVQIEAVPDPRSALARIRGRGLGCGLVVNPATPLAAVEPYLDDVDVVLVMTVQPGFGGQKFRSEVLAKIEAAASAIDRRGISVAVEVDGGIDTTTAPLVVDAGADVLVAGSAIFGKADPGAAATALRSASRRPVPAIT
ncbi:MAG: ribulose-phosphate 3-epimerase [Acidimicrobiia bacterium]